MSYRLLVVDDEEKICDIVRKYAAFEGHDVDTASDGIKAIAKVREKKYDLVVMDVMMPELDGFSAVREIRKFSSVPVIMLSARGETYDKINGFECGVDDYVSKPFSPKELMLRINAVMARASKRGGSEPVTDVFETERLKVDFAARKVFVDGAQIDLSPKEYDLLFYMVKNRGLALSREKLLSEVWGYDFYGDDRTLDTHVKLLRRSLGDCASYIVTLRGMGYRFETP